MTLMARIIKRIEWVCSTYALCYGARRSGSFSFNSLVIQSASVLIGSNWWFRADGGIANCGVILHGVSGQRSVRMLLRQIATSPAGAGDSQ